MRDDLSPDEPTVPSNHPPVPAARPSGLNRRVLIHALAFMAGLWWYVTADDVPAQNASPVPSANWRMQK